MTDLFKESERRDFKRLARFFLMRLILADLSKILKTAGKFFLASAIFLPLTKERKILIASLRAFNFFKFFILFLWLFLKAFLADFVIGIFVKIMINKYP